MKKVLQFEPLTFAKEIIHCVWDFFYTCLIKDSKYSALQRMKLLYQVEII